MKKPFLLVSFLLAAAMALSFGQDDVLLLNEKAKAALAEGRPQDAVTLLEKAQVLAPSDEVLKNNLAYAYYRRGMEKSDDGYRGLALLDLREAAALDPSEPGYAIHIGSILLSQYRLQEAERILRPVVEKHPEKTDAWILLGDTLNLADRLDESLDAYAVAMAHEDSEWASRAADSHARTSRQHAVEKDYLVDTNDLFVIKHPVKTSGPLWGNALGSVLAGARTDVCNLLDVQRSRRVTVVLYTPERFREVTGAHDWVGGLFDRKIRLPIGDLSQERDRTEAAFRHEFVHVIVSEWAPQCPSLMNEGLAQLAEYGKGHGLERILGHLDGRQETWKDLPALSELPERFLDLEDRDAVSLAYQMSYAFIDHVMAFHGVGAIERWIRASANSSMEKAFLTVTGTSLPVEEQRFLDALRSAR